MLLDYRKKQEENALKKQLKLTENELEMFFKKDILFDVYFKPKDTLNGDMIYSKIIKENEYLCVMVDAMGKGISAALSAINSISFVRHSLKKALEYNDFNFEKLLRDFINYVKSILIDNETLCAKFIYIKNNKVLYANFGQPPIFTEKGKMKANNLPIREETKNFNVDVFKCPQKMVSTSDGLIESILKNKSGVYYSQFLKSFDNAVFLKDIIRDFNEKAVQTDDISIFMMRKDDFIMDKIFEKEILISQQNLDNTLKEIELGSLPQKEKIIFILHEIFMNIVEHSVLKINTKKQKENALLKNFPKFKNINNKIRIKLYKNKFMLKLLYEDDTEGFERKNLSNALHLKHHGKGFKIIRNLSDGVFLNEKGNKIKIFLKETK
ncbi:SpoIIE family protein phosphatase [Lebetimonas sp. JH292]|uniref:SpoIIE family protein phosphatase n=1 Tax=Lebetimonas sp. JH292 TaxID=990068 RepID=UPI0004635507|nr:SpoIIE family protein phosphatase [Lebetimonas sp. JH292]